MRRALGRENTTDLPDDAREKLDIILSDVAKDARLRRAELGLEDRALNADTELKELVGDYRITVHVSLLLGDSTPNWGLIIGGDSGFHSQADNPGLYGKIQSAFVRAYRATEELGHAPGHFLLASADQTLSQTRMLLAAPFFIHSGEIAGRLAVYNLAIGTCQERLAREGTPDDTLANIDTARIEAQTDEIGMLLFSMAEQTIDWSEEKEAAVAPEAPRLEGAGGLPAVGDSQPNAGDGMSPVVADQKALSLRRTVEANTRYSLPEFNNGAAEGTMVMGALAGSAIRNIPMPGAIVQFWAKKHRSAAFDPRKPYAFDDFQVLRTNRNGTYAFGPVSTAPPWNMPTGGFAALFDERGAIVQASDMNSYVWFTYRCTIFRCRSGLVLLPPQPGASVRPNSAMAVYEARSNARLDAKKSFELMADGIFHWYCDERVDAVKLFGLAHVVGLNIAGTTRPGTHGGGLELGRGFSMTSPWEPMTMARRSAADLWHLNELRLDKLRKKDITDSSLSELHGRAEDLLAAADAEADPVRSEALAASSFMASQPVYRQARAMLDDLVFAVLILLGLSVPFAFAVERVAVGSAMIYRQIIWATVFFVATFITLFVSHPAFAVANTPVIIFLGFAVVVMSTLVIFILMRKFEMELKVLQGATSGAHVAGVSKVGTFLAAMQMGISTMRRRPLRTTLTAVTIILLTYTILCFASFSTRRGIVKVFSEPNPPYAGVWVHAIDWQPLGPDLVDVLGGRWGQQADLCPRRWICPTLQDDPGMLVTLRDGSNPVTVRGLLGLNPAELKHRGDLAALFGDELEGKVLVTQAVARKLGVKPGDQVMLSGVPLNVGPLLDAARVATATDMDGSGILPVDFTDVTSSRRGGAATIEAMETRGTWTDLPVDSVAVVSTRTAELLDADLYGLMLYTGDSAAAVGIAEDLARILTVPVAATRVNGVYLHLLGTVLAASGAKDLLFPILLGGLVVFGTMLGSVTDREKEIYTFSAVGLAPRHVATLFFAESMIYSLIGGMGGYLVAQASVKILAVLASYGLVRPPDMNMSSTNTITTILIVMATVMISAIYPAIKASRSANPGLMRSWRPPRPEGDVWNLVFPFTVSEYDITGVVSFLEEHFDNYSDTGLGRFMARQTGLVRAEDGSLGLASHITLSPFDLGVSQRFALHSVPSEIPGIDEVQIMLERTSGQPKDWHRLNKVFLDDLRQQFLFWRSLPNKTMEIYRRRTLTKLGEDANERDKNESPGGDDDE
ncbi:MAG: ABC transporter permease [Planctomycetes bacterium]|nr:ABC transporter permease [Planctomycetota bacterium]